VQQAEALFSPGVNVILTAIRGVFANTQSQAFPLPPTRNQRAAGTLFFTAKILWKFVSSLSKVGIMKLDFRRFDNARVRHNPYATIVGFRASLRITRITYRFA
jgi:hypothetical protein